MFRKRLIVGSLFSDRPEEKGFASTHIHRWPVRSSHSALDKLFGHRLVCSGKFGGSLVRLTDSFSVQSTLLQGWRRRLGAGLRLVVAPAQSQRRQTS